MQFHQFVLSYFLDQHHKVKIPSEKIASFLHFAFYSQLTSLLLYQDEWHYENKNSLSLINAFSFYATIWRPYKFLLKYENFKQYCFIIPIIFHLLLTIEIIFLWIRTKFNKKVLNPKTQFQIWIYRYIISYAYQLHFYIFFLYSGDLFIITIKYSSENFNVINLIFTVIFLFFLIIFIITNILCSEPMKFPNSTLHPNQKLILYICQCILILLALYIRELDTQWSDILVHLITLLIIGFFILIECQRPDKKQNPISLIILSYYFVYNIGLLILHEINNENQIALIFILSPFLLNLLIIYRKHIVKINIKENRNLNQIYTNLTLLHDQNEKTIDIIILEQQNINNHDIFESEIYKFNQQIINCQDKSKIEWYFKYILIQRYKNQYLFCLSLINNFRDQFIYSYQQKEYIRTQYKISYLQNLKLDNLRNEILNLLFIQITKDHIEIDKMNVDRFIQYTLFYQQLSDQIKMAFIKKEYLYKELIEGKLGSTNYYFKEIYNLTKDSLRMLDNFNNEFQQMKSFKLQQLLILLYVEFFNNLLIAEQIKNIQISTDDFKQIQFENTEYLEIQMSENLVNLQINSQSQNFLNSFGYNKKTKVQFQELFIEDTFEYHQNLIQSFFQTGTCKFIDQFSEAILKGYENIIYFISLQLSIVTFNNETGLRFYTYFKLYEEQPKSFFFNKTNEIVGYTKTFLEWYNTDISLSQINIAKHLNQIIQQQLNGVTEKIVKIVLNQDNEILVQLEQKLNLIEVQIIDDFEIQFHQQIEESQINKEKNIDINSESLVLQPNVMFYEELYSPISNCKIENRTYQELLKGETRKNITIKSKGESDQQSVQQNLGLTKQKQKLSIGNGNDEMIEDRASSKFSRGFLDNSIYYQKYNRLNQFLSQSNSKVGFIYVSLFLFLLGLLLNFILQLINLINFQPQYEKVNSDADMLALKANFMTPIHNCVTAQVCVVDYMILAYAVQSITEKDALDKMQFSMTAIWQSYEQLKTSFDSQLNNQNIQQFFFDQQLEMQQISSNQLISRNISLKTALFYYYEAQYFTSIINYYQVLTVIPSNEFIYFMANIIQIDNYLDMLSTQVSEFVNLRSQVLENDLTKFFLKMAYVEIFIIMLGMSFVLKSKDLYKKQFALFTLHNRLAVQKEIKLIQQSVQILQVGKIGQLFNFEIQTYEKTMHKFSTTYNEKWNKNYLQKQSYSTSRLVIIIILIIILLFYLLPQIILQAINGSFFNKYRNTCALLQQLSELSSSLTAIYEIREINYLINEGSPFFDYFTDEKRLEQNVKVESELKKINSFIITFPNLNLDDLLVENDFKATFQRIESENICNFIINFSKDLAEQHCNLIYSGVMKLGLYNTLSEIYKQISLEYENTNGFEIALRGKIAAYEEVEIGLISSDSIIYIQKEIYKGLIFQTQQLVTVHQVISILYIIIDFIIGIILIIFYLPYQLKQSKIIRNMIFMVPHYQFYLDQKFEVDFRLLVSQSN